MGAEMNKKEDVEKTIKEVLVDRFKISSEKIKASAILKTDLGLNSFDAVELVFELKDKFGFEIPQEEYQKINTFGDIVDNIFKNMKRS
jgi:acyl carrier protein